MEKKNAKTIQAAFKRFSANKDAIVVGGMGELLDAAVAFALQLHRDRNLPSHLSTNDSYGWAIGYRKMCLAVKVNAGSMQSESSVREVLEAMAVRYSSKNNYVGIVMAGMQPSHLYVIEHEERILKSTVKSVIANFNTYFKKV